MQMTVPSPVKQNRAIALFAEDLASGTAALSLQVLQEYLVAATRKLGLAPDLAQRKVEVFARARIVQLHAADVIAAIELHRLTKLSFWDALIVHGARSAGVSVLYREDFQDGAVLDGVRVVNLFAATSG